MQAAGMAICTSCLQRNCWIRVEENFAERCFLWNRFSRYWWITSECRSVV